MPEASENIVVLRFPTEDLERYRAIIEAAIELYPEIGIWGSTDERDISIEINGMYYFGEHATAAAVGL